MEPDGEDVDEQLVIALGLRALERLVVGRLVE
jgi:hypothetical protein